MNSSLWAIWGWRPCVVDWVSGLCMLYHGLDRGLTHFFLGRMSKPRLWLLVTHNCTPVELWHIWLHSGYTTVDAAIRDRGYEYDQGISLYGSLVSDCSLEHSSLVAINQRSLENVVYMIWVQGHAGVEGNELTDQVAKGRSTRPKRGRYRHEFGIPATSTVHFTGMAKGIWKSTHTTP